MLKITDGQCGMCAHFGADDSDQPKLVQIRVNGHAPEDLVEDCGHPDNAARDLKVTPIGSCAGYTPAKAS